MNEFNIAVGQKIFNARKSLNMSRAELGKKINLHESTVKRYEDGHINSLDIAKLKEFANALNISPTFLVGWEVTDKPLNSPSNDEDFQSLVGQFSSENNELKKIIIKAILQLKYKDSLELTIKIIEKLSQAEENIP